MVRNSQRLKLFQSAQGYLILRCYLTGSRDWERESVWGSLSYAVSYVLAWNVGVGKIISGIAYPKVLLEWNMELGKIISGVGIAFPGMWGW